MATISIGVARVAAPATAQSSVSTVGSRRPLACRRRGGEGDGGGAQRDDGGAEEEGVDFVEVAEKRVGDSRKFFLILEYLPNIEGAGLRDEEDVFANIVPASRRRLIWLGIKTFVVVTMFLWVRASFPRFRYDQIMRLGWKIFIPVTLVWLVVVGLWIQSPWNIWK